MRDLAALIALAEAQLVQCGICDHGIPGACTCPSGDPRSVIADLLGMLVEIRDFNQCDQCGTDRTWCGPAGWQHPGVCPSAPPGMQISKAEDFA